MSILFLVSLISSHILIFAGFYGLIFRRDNLIITLICLEMSLLGVALFFALISIMLGDFTGIIVFLLTLTLAGVESAMGLALVISYYRMKTSIR